MILRKKMKKLASYTFIKMLCDPNPERFVPSGLLPRRAMRSFQIFVAENGVTFIGYEIFRLRREHISKLPLFPGGAERTLRKPLTITINCRFRISCNVNGIFRIFSIYKLCWAGRGPAVPWAPWTIWKRMTP